MGAAGISPFDDDDGADFVAEIISADDMDIVAMALYSIPEVDSEYLEAPTATRALVAAEVIAAQMGHKCGGVPDELQSWCMKEGDPDLVLVERARRAVNRVFRQSELREHWKESPNFNDWKDRTRDLLKRLGS